MQILCECNVVYFHSAFLVLLSTQIVLDHKSRRYTLRLYPPHIHYQTGITVYPFRVFGL